MKQNVPNHSPAMIHSLGYACINETLAAEGVTASRTLRLKNFSLQRAGELALRNFTDLRIILKWNIEHHIHMFRLPSGILPLADHPEVGYEITLALSGPKSRRKDD